MGEIVPFLDTFVVARSVWRFDALTVAGVPVPSVRISCLCTNPSLFLVGYRVPIKLLIYPIKRIQKQNISKTSQPGNRFDTVVSESDPEVKLSDVC